MPVRPTWKKLSPSARLPSTNPKSTTNSAHALAVSQHGPTRTRNFDSDPKVKKDLLDQAVTNAQQAVDLEKAYPDYAYTALGNALEDVAWQVGEDPEKNYRAPRMLFHKPSTVTPPLPRRWSVGPARILRHCRFQTRSQNSWRHTRRRCAGRHRRS